MPKGYWMVRVDVTDPDNYPQYLQAGRAAMEKYGANFLVRGGDHHVVEGQSRSRHVIVEWPSYAAAVEAYGSPEYQAAAKLRQQFGETDFVIIEGAE
ncbi:MAG: DUF1330 domain-containing protein [Pseudomonadota bacterium]